MPPCHDFQRTEVRGNEGQAGNPSGIERPEVRKSLLLRMKRFKAQPIPSTKYQYTIKIV